MGGLKWKGDLKALNGFERLIDGMPETLDNGLERCIKVAFKTSQIMVPKKTTALQKTGTVNEARGFTRKRSQSFTYGEQNGPIDYAAAVHEILKASHAAPTQAKYVEAALLENLGGNDRRFALAFRASIRKAFR